MWVAGPAAAGSWVTGAPRSSRSSRRTATRSGPCSRRSALDGSNPPFELDNRNKRSIALDLSHRRRPADRGRADRRRRCVRLQRPARPRWRGPGSTTRRCRPATRGSSTPTSPATGSRATTATGPPTTSARSGRGPVWPPRSTPEGTDLPYQRGGMGDHMAGMADGRRGRGRAARPRAHRRGAARHHVAAAHRHLHDRLGHQHGPAPAACRRSPMTVAAPPNPLISAYTAGDGAGSGCSGSRPSRHWPDVLRAVDRPEWAERRAVRSTRGTATANSAELVRELNAIFAAKPLDEWARDLRPRGRVVGAGADAHEMVDDPQVGAAGGFVDVPRPTAANRCAWSRRRPTSRARRAGAALDAAGARAAHRGGAARARLRLGRDHRAQGRRRHPLSTVIRRPPDRSSPQSTAGQGTPRSTRPRSSSSMRPGPRSPAAPSS